MEEELKLSIEEKKLLAIKYKYYPDALFMYTIGVSSEFYFGVEEYDFELAGYQIRKFDDIDTFEAVENYSGKINEFEGLPDKVIHYPINLNSFYDVFKYLESLNTVISIEREYYDEDHFFLIGEIIKVTEDEVWFRDFNVNGIWNEDINIVPFDIITTIRFNSKYINTWMKYMK